MSPSFVASGESLMTLVFYVLTLVFALFTIIVVYHWFTYGNDKKLSMLSAAIFLLSAAPLMVVMAVSLRFM